MNDLSRNQSSIVPPHMSDIISSALKSDRNIEASQERVYEINSANGDHTKIFERTRVRAWTEEDK